MKQRAMSSFRPSRRAAPDDCPSLSVKSRCGAVAVGPTYLFPPLSSGGALVVRPSLVSTSRSSNRTCRSPASGSRTRPHAFAFACDAICSFEHQSELIGYPISRSFATYCVCLELRSLPSTGVTQLQRYYEPLRHPRAPGLSLTGVQLVVAGHALGFPVFRASSLCACRRHYPGAASGLSLRSFHPDVSAFPERVVGSACALSFSRLAQRSLTLRPAHSRCHQFVTR